MVKFIALYKTPADIEAFEKRYFEQHLPIASKIPGLRKMEVTRMTPSPMGEPPYHLMAELYFDNLEAMNAGFSSPEGKATAKDVMSFAKDIITMMYAEEVKTTVSIG